METTEDWGYDDETVTMNSYYSPPAAVDGISRVERPVMTLTKCGIHNFYVFTVVGSVVVLFGLIGNTLTISVLWKDRGKSPTHFLLAVLAVTDILVILSSWMSSNPLSFARIYLNPRIHRNLVSASYVYLGRLTSSSLMATIWLTVLVTWQRYLSVCFPQKFKTLASLHRVKVLTVAIIIFSLLFSIPRYFEKRLVYFQPRPGFISFTDTALGQSEAFQVCYNTILFYLFYYILPLLALLYMTGALIVGLKKASKIHQEMMKNTLAMATANNKVQKNKNEVTLSIIIVVVAFMICHFMAPIRRILLLFNPVPIGHQCGVAVSYMQPYVVLSTEINSAVNFIIYIVCVKRFRHGFFRMFKRRFRIAPHSASSNNDNPHTEHTGPIHSS